MEATYSLIKAILWSKKDGVSLIDRNKTLEESQNDQPKHKKTAWLPLKGEEIDLNRTC